MKKNWEIKTLGEVCDIINGGTPKTNIDEYWNGNINWITPKDMGKLTSKYVYETERNITELGLKKSSAKLIPKNSIILSSRAPIGHLAINKVEISTNQGCKGIIPLNINEHYIYYFLLNSVEYLDSLGSGTTFKELSNTKLSEVLIPIPPIEEQKEIVERLDKGFELIDSLKETAKKNLDNAKELFQSVLREELSPKEGWETKTLGELCIIAPQKKEVREKLNDNDLVTFLPMEDLGIMQKNINPQKTKLLSEVINGYTYFAENDILLAKVTPCFENGKLGIAKNLCNQIGFGSSEYIVLRAKDIKSEYIYYNLSSESFRNNGKKLMIGACGLKRLPKDYVNNFEIHFPESSKEQDEIVERLDRIKGYCEELEGNYKRVLELCEELKQGLLREAFSY